MQYPSYISQEATSPDRRLIYHAEAPVEPSFYTDEDEDAWSKKTVLSIDGGGVRGLSTLLILRELMEEIGAIERRASPKAKTSAYSPLVDCLREGSSDQPGAKSDPRYFPCHYFDYICGASTGGLVAIMVGRLRMSVDEAIEEYRDLAAKLFEKQPSRLRKFLAKYDSTAKRENLRGHFDAWRPLRLASPQGKAYQFKSNPVRCRTVVCSIRSSEKNNFHEPFLFRSYDPKDSSTISFDRNPDEANDLTIWKVARATLAAPYYFKSIDLLHERYYDAATSLNNPSLEVMEEVNLLAGSFGAIDSLLSLGSGNFKGSNSSPRKMSGSESLLRDLSSISESVHEEVRYASKLHSFDYHRFEVEEGLQDVTLDEWRPKISGKITFQKIEAATKMYLRKKEVRNQIQECARFLVGKRTLRAQTMRWERFATGTRYQCPFSGCPISDARFNDRNELLDHMRMRHNQAPPDADHFQEVQMLLDRGRTNSEQED